MKIPLLSRRVQNKRFHFEPRYYDPIKEDIKNRTTRISAELKRERSMDSRENIQSAYQTMERRERSISFMQVILMLLMLGGFFGWIYYGNTALYIFIVLFPLYIYMRTRKNFR